MWRSLTSRVALAGVVIAALFAGLVVVFVDASDSSSRSWAQRNHADHVLDTVNTATDQVIDVEMGLRGFALTRQQRFLQPFWSAQAELPVTMTRLVTLTQDDPAFTAPAHAIEIAVADYVHGFALPLMRRIAATRPVNMERQALEGQLQVNRLRVAFGRLQRAVRAQQRAAAVRVRSENRRVRRIGLLGLAGALALLGVTIVVVARGARRLDALNDDLEQRVDRRTAELERSREETLQRLARAAEWRDDETRQHAERIGRTAALLAAELGLDDATCAHLRSAAPLHDIGKIATPDAILLKRGRLTDEEMVIMRRHAQAGAQILSGSESAVLRLAEEIARTHHERWDGQGYPHGLSGREIPLSGRIVAVADVFDALTHARPYKPAWPLAAALEEIRRGAGTHFDPAVVAAFERLDHVALVGFVDESRRLFRVA
jgi:putative nucleotidyltransferase with HDIG domain